MLDLAGVLDGGKIRHGFAQQDFDCLDLRGAQFDFSMSMIRKAIQKLTSLNL